MDNKHKGYCYIIGGAVLLALLAVIIIRCTNVTYRPIDNVQELYAGAVASINNTQNLCLKVSREITTTQDDATFTQNTTQTIYFENIGTDKVRVSVEEALHSGTYEINITETYTDGVGYIRVNEGTFTSLLSQEEYLARLTPAVLLEPTLYGSITGTSMGGNTLVVFADAKQLEGWLSATDAVPSICMGTAYLDKDGLLVKNTYEANYTIGEVAVRQCITVEIDYAGHPSINPPKDISGYIPITHPDAPRVLEIACGQLMEAQAVNTTYTDQIICQAFGDQRKQTIAIRAADKESWQSQVDTTVALSNSGKIGSESVRTKSESFTDGTYTIAVDGGESTFNKEIDSTTMENFCRDILVGTLVLPQHIADVAVEETEDAYKFTFNGTEALAQQMSSDACATLYQDTEILTKQAQAYTTEAMRCYLTIRKSDGLPIDSGFHYTGVYTIDALPYTLEYSANQQYHSLTVIPTA